MEEFEIKQIHANNELSEGNKLKSRSLVFKISKRINKEVVTSPKNFTMDNFIKQKEDLSPVNNKIPDSFILKEENGGKTTKPSNIELPVTTGIHVENGAAVENPKTQIGERNDSSICPLKLQELNSTVIQDKGPALRRTSRRLILRVNKEVLSRDHMIKKNVKSQKEKEDNSQIVKQDSDKGK
ncbi:hypothetical protein CDAR_104961 [Caerostris darwini]|uniref:Uncharacterized protein n=1 Tax=Caerostris darwini TaxID=1538125 RepID=A0AAV4V5T4_9ARAC|nr:hypothetical protein CDAR_104961 [Caerostris darwini]